MDKLILAANQFADASQDYYDRVREALEDEQIEITLEDFGEEE